MLTDEQCNEFRRLPMSFNDMVRAIYEAGRASKAAEYADVPPEKFKRLYKFCRSAKRRTIPQTYALNVIDNGTYNPKIGGE